MKIKKYEWKYKGYHIYRHTIINTKTDGKRWQFEVVSYANEFKPLFFSTLKHAKEWIDRYLMNDKNFGGVF